MLQFVIIARDGDDGEALARRMACREAHLEGARSLKAKNNFIVGGAMLDEGGKMNGSVMIVQFETEAAFREWYDNEPYITNHVWQQVEVQPFRVADV